VAREVRELVVGEQEIGPFRLTTRVQPGHSTPTLALRFGDALTYCTDTPYDAGNVELAAGSRVLMHEAWYAESAPQGGPIHSSGRHAAAVAREAGVERLVLIHLHPDGGHDALLEEARGVFEATELGADGLELEL
jgi:ribonuclease BN (tRNA processing enzyme)